MRFYKYLYVGDSIKHPAKVKRKLKTGAGQMKIYIIALSPGDNQLEIYHCAYLQQKYYKRNPPVIIGISGGYDEAVELVQKIALEAIALTGACNIKSYLRQQVDLDPSD